MGEDKLSQQRAAEIWDRFCDTLKEAKATLFHERGPDGAQDLAAGVRMLSRNIPIALDKMFENADPLHPAFIHHNDWRHKFAGDNPDCLYLWAPINGSDSYRITGMWGNAAYIVFTINDYVNTVTGGKVAANLFGNDVIVEDDGSFEVIIGPEEPDPRPKNWMKSNPTTFRVLLRQFFGDWENEEKITLRIDRLGDAPPAEMTPESVNEGLIASARQVADLTAFWVNTLSKWQPNPLRFLSFQEVTQGTISAASPGGANMSCYWEMGGDEAIVVRVRPPKAQYWNMEIGNWWYESMDYRHRLSSTNSHYAELEDDGELIVVVSHDDPGVPNWLDASGYSRGHLTVRWMKAETTPVPLVERIKRSELCSRLPAKVHTIDAAARKEQIAARNRGVMKRFNGF